MITIKSKIKVDTKRNYETFHISGTIDDKEFCVEFVPSLEIWDDVNNNLKGGADIKRIKDHYFEMCTRQINDGKPFYWERGL